jgi:hypothetical protein
MVNMTIPKKTKTPTFNSSFVLPKIIFSSLHGKRTPGFDLVRVQDYGNNLAPKTSSVSVIGPLAKPLINW